MEINGIEVQEIYYYRDMGLSEATMGIPKAKVFPVPVGALATTSFHSMKQGMAPPWMAVAWVKPFFSSAFMVASDRPMSR